MTWLCSVSVYFFQLVKYQSLSLPWGFTISDHPVQKTNRSSHQRCSLKTVFLEIWQNSEENKHLYQSLLFDKVAGLSPATLLKKRLWHKCFLVNFANFLRRPFFREHFWWLLLYVEPHLCRVS